MLKRLLSWLAPPPWCKVEHRYDGLIEALDLCKCTGQRRYVQHLYEHYGLTPIDAAVECVTNIGNFIHANNIGPDASASPEPAPPEPVAPIDLASMNAEEEERVFYALLANRYERRLTDLSDALIKAGHGTPAECKALADRAVTSWCAPLEEDLDVDDLLELLKQSGALNG